jgi:hypothetical protein
MNPDSHLVTLKDLKRHRLTGGEMRQIEQGALVKLCMENLTPDSKRTFAWIRITSVTWPTFEGVFESAVPDHGIVHGDAITIEARHLVEIKTADRQSLEREMCAEIVTITAEALECVGEPKTGTFCDLGNGAMLMVEQMDDECIGMITQFFAPCDTGEWTEEQYGHAFFAVVSDLMKDSFPVQYESNSCSYAVSVPITATGSALLSKVRKSLEEIHDLTRASLGQMEE